MFNTYSQMRRQWQLLSNSVNAKWQKSLWMPKVRTCGHNPLFLSHDVKQRKKRTLVSDKQLPVEMQQSNVDAHLYIEENVSQATLIKGAALDGAGSFWSLWMLKTSNATCAIKIVRFSRCIPLSLKNVCSWRERKIMLWNVRNEVVLWNQKVLYLYIFLVQFAKQDIVLSIQVKKYN